MNPPKQGDHVFNDVPKTLRQLDDLVREVFDAELLNRSPGLSENISALRHMLTELLQHFRSSAFALTVQKGEPPPDGDANSRQYGNAKNRVRWAFRQFLVARKNWETTPKDKETWLELEQLRVAYLHLKLAINHWIDFATDPEAVDLAQRQDPASGDLIMIGKAILNEVRVRLLDPVKRLSG